MKPRHVLTFNIIFIMKWLILAILLVMYKVMTGTIQTYVIACIHLAFLFHFCTCWWYMSLFKKFLHIVTDLLVFIVLLFPVFQNSFSQTAGGTFIVTLFSVGIIFCILISFIALIIKFVFYIIKKIKNSNSNLTFPKEKQPYDPNVMVK